VEAARRRGWKACRRGGGRGMGRGGVRCLGAEAGGCPSHGHGAGTADPQLASSAMSAWEMPAVAMSASQSQSSSRSGGSHGQGGCAQAGFSSSHTSWMSSAEGE
jgi:hypothetical protein